MMNVGKLQRRWAENMPQVYDKETRIVCFDIRKEKRKDMDGNDVDGYSYIKVEIDRQIDYGHIKSQLIEAGFAQKDEFGLLMNAVGDIVKAVKDNDTYAKFRSAINTADVAAFQDFCTYRDLCAQTAKEVIKAYF